VNKKLYNFYANDKLAFFSDHVKIRNNKRGKITNIEMPQWKTEFLLSDHILIRKIRDAGVSELIAADMVYNLNFKSDFNMIYMTTNGAMANLHEERISRHFNNIPGNIRTQLKSPLIKNKYSTVVNNNNIIFSGPSEIIGRGWSFGAVYIDEADSMNSFENIFASLLPAIQYNNGKIAISSTPTSGNSYFEKLWKDRTNLFDRVELSHNSNSTLPKFVKKKSLNDITKTAYSKIIRDCVIK